MSINRLILLQEYDLAKKKDYSEPEIYDAGGDLSARCYIYYSFRNPETGYLERQTPIYHNVHQFKNLRDKEGGYKDPAQGHFRHTQKRLQSFQ